MHGSMHLGEQSPKLRGIWLLRGHGMSSNVYLIGRREATLVDTGIWKTRGALLRELDEIGVASSAIKQIVLTHGHYDHTSGIPFILEEAEPVIMVHEREAGSLERKLRDRVARLADGDVVKTSLFPLTVIHTPGHTAGSLCLYSAERRLLFSGDTIFAGGFFGRTDLPTGSWSGLVESLGRLTQLDVEFLLPGHEQLVLGRAHRYIRSVYERVA